MAYGTRSKRFVPRLEVLGDRALPSVTAVVDGGVLKIHGDQAANTIEITDTGAATPDAITVLVDGEPLDVTLTDPVEKIVVCSRGGQDTVSYNLTGDFADGTDREVVVYLGNQHDTFTADLGGSIGADSDVTLRVYGENGHDTLSVTGAGAVDSPFAVDGNLTVKLNGGNGKDTLSFDYAGLFNGTVDFNVHGGNGKDVLNGTLTAEDGSTGTVNAKVCGGNGKDEMGLTVDGAGATGVDLTAELRGGHGKDIYADDLGDNVTVIDTQKV
jgi:hypothetical protein